MYKESENLIAVKQKTVPENADISTRNYSYNLLPFNFPEGKTTIVLSTEGREVYHRFSLKSLPEELRKQFIVDGMPAEFVYADFSDDATGTPVEIDLRKHPAVARAWFTQALNRVMRKHADVVNPNFLHDTECWFEETYDSNHKYRKFKKFSLRVQFHHETGQPELLISFDGYAHTTVESARQLSARKGYRRSMARRMVFRGGCYRRDHIPQEARYHPEEVYPLLNRQLKSLLNISIPVKPNREKHLKFREKVKWFYTEFAGLEEFIKAIPHTGQFREVDAENLFTISTNDDLLEFGEGHTGRDIHDGFRNHGPVKLPPCDEAGYFYIYARQQADIKDRFDTSLRGGSSGNRISGFARVPLMHEKTMDIVFDANHNPLETILNKIRLLETKSAQCYYAFFINPWSKYENNRQKQRIYFRVKEMLLLRDIMMQNMDASKIAQGNLNFFMPNLAAAFTGKLGGIPWRLKRPHNNELIVGFGVFRSKKFDLKYTASSVCFSNDGSFEAFDCFRADDTYSLAATVEKALYRYVEAYEKPKRLVIHFYRKLSWKDLRPVELMLRELKLNIPVIVVSINKSYSNNITAFMHQDAYGLPPAGTVINYRPWQYLLYLNDRAPDAVRYSGFMPMPLKISLWSNSDDALDNRETVSTLIQQVYDFCFLYYRSVRHARLPVTIVYPEMLAGIVPYFRDEVLQEERAGRMMFL